MSFGIPVRNGLGAGLLASTFLSSLRIGGRPAMFLDFIGTTALDSRITFTRATTATFTGSNGAIQSSAINAPRFDYDPATLAPKGLLIEEARTNSLTGVDSVNPTGITGWTTFGDAAGSLSVVSDNAALAAAGLSGLCSTGKVFKLDNSAGTTPFYARVDNAITLGVNTWAFSTYARGSGSFSFDVNAGTWTPGGTSPAVTSVYQRIVSIGASNVSSNQYRVSVTGGSVVYFILMQAEQGSFPTSVIPNTGTSVTRNADLASMTGTNFSSWYNQSEGTFVAVFDRIATNTVTFSGGQPRVFRAVDAGTNFIIAGGDSGSGEKMLVRSGGSDVANITSGVQIAANTVGKMAAAYAVNNFGLSVNGGAVGTDTSGAAPTGIDTLYLGDGSTATRALNGHIRQMAYYNTRLPNTTLRTLTA